MSQNTRPINSAVQTCPCVKHSFDVLLAPAPDASPRPDWWPVDSGSAYGGESMDIALAGVDARQTLSGSAAYSVTGIPPGVAKVQFKNFYDDVHADIEQRTQLPVD